MEDAEEMEDGGDYDQDGEEQEGGYYDEEGNWVGDEDGMEDAEGDVEGDGEQAGAEQDVRWGREDDEAAKQAALAPRAFLGVAAKPSPAAAVAPAAGGSGPAGVISSRASLSPVPIMKKLFGGGVAGSSNAPPAAAGAGAGPQQRLAPTPPRSPSPLQAEGDEGKRKRRGCNHFCGCCSSAERT